MILELSVPDLIAGHDMRRLVRKGVPFKTPTYIVDGKPGLGCHRPASSSCCSSGSGRCSSRGAHRLDRHAYAVLGRQRDAAQHHWVGLGAQRAEVGARDDHAPAPR